MAWDDLRINADRLLADLEALSRIGATPEGGVTRPALSDADLQARQWFQERAAAAGLMVRQDGIGNVSASLPADDPAAPVLLCGSHLDTVPDGGRFDGALGVIAALETLRAVKEAGLKLPVALEAISFTDEEGAWGTLPGSRGFAGKLTPADFERPRQGREALAERMAAAGLTVEGALRAARPPDTLKAWVEVHIEQGTRLEESQTNVGVVTGIVGIASYWLTFMGRADHAGTTPMDKRLDAMRGLAAFIQQARESVLLRVEVEHAGACDPAPMHRDVIAAIEGACGLLGLSSRRMAS